LQVLVVRPSSGKDEWLFPKGHIESGEMEVDAAVRELREEAGVQGSVVGVVDHAPVFMSKRERVQVRYYVVEFERDVPAAEQRGQGWLPVTLAAEVLTHEHNLRVLLLALPSIERHLAATERGDGAFAEFLKLELQHTTESFLKSEEDGERRAKFFLTVAAGAGAVLIFLLGGAKYDPREISGAIVFVLVVLLLFGYFVVLRLVKRNRTSDDCKEKPRRIRLWFSPNLHDPRRAWVAFDPFEPPSPRALSYWGPTRGGWLEILLLVEAILGGALIAALIPTLDLQSEGLVLAAGAVVCWLLLVARAKHLLSAMDRPDTARTKPSKKAAKDAAKRAAKDALQSTEGLQHAVEAVLKSLKRS
jgi:ADP-ribose pyrophosphatase YjhB (NUDIX family)